MDTLNNLIGIVVGLLMILVLTGLCFLIYEGIEALRAYTREHGGRRAKN